MKETPKRRLPGQLMLVADDLGTWTPAAATVVSRTFGPGTETLTLTVPAPAPGAARRFVRMEFILR